jgi:hypothetical protein
LHGSLGGILKNRLLLCVGLLAAVELRPTGLELVAGALAYKALSSKTVKTLGAVLAGYFLNTVAGKQLAAKIKDLTVKKMFTNYTNNFELSRPIQDSYSDPVLSFLKQSSVGAFSKASSSLASIKEKMRSVNPFKIRDSKINLFYSSEHAGVSQVFSAGIYQPFRTATAQTDGAGQAAASSFVYDAKVTNVMAQQVRGFGSKIENNFNFGSYWKGFAHGSFGAWLTAWFLTVDTKNKEEKNSLILHDPALSKESFLDKQQEPLIKQDLAS